MDQETKEMLAAQQKRIEEIYASVEKTRKYFLATLIISVLVFVVPLLGLLFALPMAVDTVTHSYELQELGL
jgi:hypothetical protein